MDRDIKPMVYFIGNTHYDPVWLWTWDEALASIRSTFRSALDRMNEYPDYTYSFCTPAVFEMIEKGVFLKEDGSFRRDGGFSPTAVLRLEKAM